ncbi:MAG: hypothetical protein HY905_22965 [Deltaproteobacteria bacterium]|nr:hypothetical protein [Deltaproteobacteria bacterium]
MKIAMPFVVLGALALTACPPPPAPPSGTADAAVPDESADVAATGEAGDAPTPYTAEQIRDASRPGRTYRYLVEIPGAPNAVREIRFEAVDVESATLRSTTTDEAGNVLQATEPMTVAWEELRRHALFPQDAVELTEAEVTVPAGTFVCVVYTVTTAEGVEVYQFAKDLPGPPVRFWTEAGGARTMTSTLVEYLPGTEAAGSP